MPPVSSCTPHLPQHPPATPSPARIAKPPATRVLELDSNLTGDDVPRFPLPPARTPAQLPATRMIELDGSLTGDTARAAASASGEQAYAGRRQRVARARAELR